MTFRNGFLLLFFTFFSFSIFGDDTTTLMAKGVKQYQDGKYIDSIYYMNAVLEEKNSLYTEALFWKAKSQYELGHYDDSKETLELLFRKGSIVTAYYEDARFLYCKVFFKLKKYEDSILLFKQFRRNEAFTFYQDSSLFWLGESYLQLSKISEAKEYYNLYLVNKPKSRLAKERLILIDRMLALLTAVESSDPTVVDKAAWLTDYVIKELKDNRSEIKDDTVSSWINRFKTREQFFYYLEKEFLDDVNKKSEEAAAEDVVDITPDSDTINTDTEKELNELEGKILEELEKKLLDVIGDED